MLRFNCRIILSTWDVVYFCTLCCAACELCVGSRVVCVSLVRSFIGRPASWSMCTTRSVQLLVVSLMVNRLESLPPCMGFLPIKTLAVSTNLLSSLPDTFAHLKGLQILD